MLIVLSNFKNIFLVADLRRKLMYTLGVLAVYRFGVQVPMPGINTMALKNFMEASSAGGFFRYLDLFSGGSLKTMAIFALGMMPYISASIMMQLLTVMVPTLEALAKEGEYGRKIINQYTRYLALGLSLFHGFGMANLLERLQEGLVISPGWSFKLTTMLILSVGSIFVMWLGEQINNHGLGNGTSVIIFASIVAGLPLAILKVLGSVSTGQMNPITAGFLVLFVGALIACIVFLERGERRISVQYAKRVVGQRVYSGSTTYIPFKLNSAGVVPVIFASAVLTMPIMLAKMLFSRFGAVNTFADWLDYGSLLNTVLTVFLIVFFSFFYTAIIFNPVELADNIRKAGGYILGLRPGKKTAEFFDYVLTRVGLPGALYLATLAILPRLLQTVVSSPVWFDGVSLLIAVGVGLDTSAQIESTLIERRYGGFLTSGRLKGRLNR